MTRARFAKLFVYTIAALLGLAALSWIIVYISMSGCRGEGCGFLILAPIFWVILLWPILLLALLVEFAVASAYRMKDIGLPYFIGVLPALLVPDSIQTVRSLAGAAPLWFASPIPVLYLIPLIVLLVTVVVLFACRTQTVHTNAGDPVFRVVTIAAAISIVLSIPFFLLSSMMMDSITLVLARRGGLQITYMLGAGSAWVSYLRLAALVVFGFGLLRLVRSRPRQAEMRTPPPS